MTTVPDTLDVKCEECKKIVDNLANRQHGFLCDNCDPLTVALNQRINADKEKKKIARKRYA